MVAEIPLDFGSDVGFVDWAADIWWGWGLVEGGGFWDQFGGGSMYGWGISGNTDAGGGIALM
jgi:hypothetical protein